MGSPAMSSYWAVNSCLCAEIESFEAWNSLHCFMWSWLLKVYHDIDHNGAWINEWNVCKVPGNFAQIRIFEDMKSNFELAVESFLNSLKSFSLKEK